MAFGGFLKADTETKVIIGPVVEVANGYVPVTNLALNTADEAELFKHNAAAVTDISAFTFSAIVSADGYYNLTLTAGSLDTEGRLTIIINDDSLCLPIKESFEVINANVHASLFEAAATDYLQVDTLQVEGSDATNQIGDATADEEYDNDGTAISLRGAIKLLLAVLTGKSSGGGTSTLVFRDVNDAKNRISATVDSDGNRTAVGTRDAV